VHSVSEVLSACKILDGGVTPSLKYGEKNASAAKPILRQDVGRRPADTAAQLLTISGVSYFTRCTYASDARDVASVWSVPGLYVHA